MPVKFSLASSLKSTSVTTAALAGTGLAVLTLSLGGIAGLSDDVRAASEAQQQRVQPPAAQWEEFVDDPAPATSPQVPPTIYDRDGEPIGRGY